MTQENAANNGATAESIEKALERTDLGHIINQNKNKVLVFFALVLVVAVGASIYSHKKKSNLTADLSAVHAFKVAAITPYIDGKISAQDFMQKFSSVSNDVQSNNVFLAQIMSVVKKMEDTDPQKAFEIITQIQKNVSEKSPLYLLYALKYAALAEDNGKSKDAIAVLEKAMNTGGDGIKATVYLQLGRLYRTEDAAKAKKNFEFVVDKYPNDPAAKLAKLYLAELK